MEPLLTRAQAAEYLERIGAPVAHATLAKLASIGGGPRFRRFGRKPVYAAADLDAWVAGRMTESATSTSELSDVGGQP